LFFCSQQYDVCNYDYKPSYVNISNELNRATSLYLLWGLINTLQIIVNLPLLNINFPANAMYLRDFNKNRFFYGLLVDLSNINVLPYANIEAGMNMNFN